MAKKTDQQVEDLAEEIDKIKKKVKTVESDIYSPEAQKSFSEYTGSREEFRREKKLRQIASGKKDTATSQTLRFVAAAVFGNRDLTAIVRERFQTRYTKEEIEQAKKTLEEKFGVKKQKEKQTLSPQRLKKELNDALEPIKSSIMGLSVAVDKVSQEASSINRGIKSISTNLVGTINDALTVLAKGRGSLERTPEQMKPLSVADEEGKEYLYYPDAPTGRQLYEKSKIGTAGKIASKKVQRKLDAEIKRLSRETNLKPVRFATGDAETNSIVDRIKILLEEESMFRKKDMELLVKDLKESLIKKQPNSVFDLEADEQQAILQKAMEKALDATLYDALKRVFRENPDLLPGSGFDFPTFIPGRNTRAPTPTPDGGKKKIPEKIKDIIQKIPLPLRGRLLGGAGLLGLATIPTMGIFDSLDFGLKESGNRAIQNISRGSVQDIATAIQVPKYGPYTLQELERMAADDPSLKIKLDKAKEIAGLKPISRTDLNLSPPKPAEGQQIVDMNQKRIEIQSADRVEIPSQTVNQINNTQVIPVPYTKKNIEVHNQENTFNRLLAQEFDHPATYANMNMG
jgi:hypothetical protein